MKLTSWSNIDKASRRPPSALVAIISSADSSYFRGGVQEIDRCMPTPRHGDEFDARLRIYLLKTLDEPVLPSPSAAPKVLEVSHGIAPRHYPDGLARRQLFVLIEFKANNTLAKHHEKDFVKLNEEGSEKVMTYFLEIVKSSDDNTIDSLKKKKESYKGEFRCWSCREKRFIIE